MRDATIIKLYKNKGDRSVWTDCNNYRVYRGISVMSITGKVVARVLLCKQLLTAVYPKSPYGFRAGRSTTDVIFTVRQLQEKSREHGKPLYLVFIDETKAFDLVIRKGQFQLLEKIGCSSKLLNHCLSPTTKAWGAPCMKSGVKQGCVLAPTLFGIFFSSSCPMPLTLPLTLCTGNSSAWLASAPRPKSKLYLCLTCSLLMILPWQHIPRQQCRGPSTNSASSVKTLASLNQPQENQCEHEYPGCQPSPWNQNRRPHFRFNHLHMNSSFDSEISRRISKAPAPRPNWKKRAWKNKYLTENTKMYIYIYQACVLSTLLCGSELGPPKWDRTPLELFPFAIPQAHPRRQVARPYQQQWDIPSMPSLCSQRRLRWLGHVHRMDDTMDASPRKFCSDNWKQESGKPGAPPCGSWKLTNVTSKHAKLIQAIGTMLLVNVPAGDGQWKKESRMQTWNLVLQSALGFC